MAKNKQTQYTQPIYFYFPQEVKSESFPANAADYWSWQCAEHAISPMASGGCFWTLQTYLNLKDYGFNCELVKTLPEEGIVISHRDYLGDQLRPGAKVLLICLRADVNRHPYAQLHVVQNPHQVIPKGMFSLWESYFIPHWPQPAIIPRDPSRADTFTNVTFMGNEINLVPEFRSEDWYRELELLGLRFQKKLHHNEWHDYSDTDVILAIRDFGSENQWRGKPASKLYNAWHAGIPAILGHESAFQLERKTDLDYLEATSMAEVLSALKILKQDPELRRQMVNNGWQRAQETHPDQMVGLWQDFLTSIAEPAYHQWRSRSAWQQQAFFRARNLHIQSRPAYYQLKTQLSKMAALAKG
jgi:hypothetical protein